MKLPGDLDGLGMFPTEPYSTGCSSLLGLPLIVTGEVGFRLLCCVGTGRDCVEVFGSLSASKSKLCDPLTSQDKSADALGEPTEASPCSTNLPGCCFGSISAR